MENGNGHSGTMTVKEAAEHLGISPRGVRQRITRGRLKATQLNGEWLVYLGEHAEPVPENNEERNTEPFPGTKGNGTAYRRSPVPSANQQLDAVMHSWLAPLTKTIQEQAEEIGTLRAQLAQEQKEKAILAEALQDTYPEDDEEKPCGLWAWLRGR